MTERLGDAPIEPQYIEVMKNFARMLDTYLNGPKPQADPKNGFIVMMFPLAGHEGRCNYISNAKREDVVIMLREQLRRFEGMPEASGRG